MTSHPPPPTLTNTTQTLHFIAEAAVHCEEHYGCPAEFIAAQCILESGWLQHAPGNNCFGVKWTPGSPYGKQLLHTTEDFTDAELKMFLAAVGYPPGRSAQRDPKRTYGVPSPFGTRYHYIVQDWFAWFTTLSDCFAYRARLFLERPYLASFEQWKVDGDLAPLVKRVAAYYATDEVADYEHKIMSIVADPKVKEALREARNPPEATPVEEDVPIPAPPSS